MISSNPTAEEKVQYAAWLKDAETAYHKLMTADSAVSVGYNGETVTFTAANKNTLKNYISELRSALGMPRLVNRGLAFKTPVFGRRKF